ncbi:MAG: RNA polymerase factor sigma-54 [Desulfitobacteriaceae bacterium]
MRLGYGLSLEQTQKLVMTPELRQAIAILQLSALELSTFVDQQLLENPLLEVQEEPEQREEAEQPPPGAEAEIVETKWEMDWHDYFQGQDDSFVRTERQRPMEQDRPQYDPFIAAAPTLQEHLLLQLHVQKPDVSLALAEYIVGNLDDRGYLTLSVEEIAREKNVSVAEAEKAVTAVQVLDPLGVGARSLEECLRLQLSSITNCPTEMPAFLKHLEDLAAGRYQRIANDMKISLNQVQELSDIVRCLDPKPGLRFSAPGDVRFIVPDVVVEEIEGEYFILVNDITVPRLRVNQVYRKALNQAADTEARKFVEQKLNAAAWLIKSIEQRRLTLYKVANAIVHRQKDFLHRGIRYLKPLTLRDIADEVGVHESTVSRATANKYVQTPRGIFELKFFFATGIGHEQRVTTESIKQALRDLIASEDTKDPFSDQKLANILKSRGMEISRRTVAKYRDALHISVASARKRY